jgi:hypothetical protein
VCIDRFDTDTLGGWKPNEQLLKRGWGKNIEIFEKNPTEKVKARLEKMLASPNTILQENRTDICTAKLLVALRYLKTRRQEAGARS